MDLTPHRDGYFRVAEDGTVVGPRGKALKQFPSKRGYLRVNSYDKLTKTWSQHFVHVLVCETFHGERPEGKWAAHNDGNQLNNRADNLSWKTHEENNADKNIHGTHLKGERHHQAKLTEADVLHIRELKVLGMLQKDIAYVYSVDTKTISNIIRRKSWSHV